MGMFDDVICEAPLPDGWEGKCLQTKDLDCLLCIYTITKGGRLIRTSPAWYEDSDKTVISEDTNFHGILNFYGHEDLPDKQLVWHEYNAKFTDGNLVSITKVEEPDGLAKTI